MRGITRKPSTGESSKPDVLSELEVNGRQEPVHHPVGETLLDTLRNRLVLLGTKRGCDGGECGACTVLIGDVPVFACVTLTARVRDRVETIEGLAERDTALREAFADTGGFQCGYCTPGQLVRAAAMLRAGTVPEDDTELRHQLAGNVCRCTGYAAIVEAIRAADPRRERQ